MGSKAPIIGKQQLEDYRKLCDEMAKFYAGMSPQQRERQLIAAFDHILASLGV